MTKPLTHEEYFAAVGRAIHLYTATENMMFSAFVFLAATDMTIGRAIWFTLEAFSAKRTMLQRVVAARQGHPVEKTATDRIIGAVETANKLRRQVAHVHIHAIKEEPTQIHLKDLSNAPERDVTWKTVSRGEMEHLVKTLQECEERAEAALIDLWRLGEPEILRKARQWRGGANQAASRRRKTPEPASAKPRQRPRKPRPAK
jgi:hypothetical protein